MFEIKNEKYYHTQDATAFFCHLLNDIKDTITIGWSDHFGVIEITSKKNHKCKEVFIDWLDTCNIPSVIKDKGNTCTIIISKKNFDKLMQFYTINGFTLSKK